MKLLIATVTLFLSTFAHSSVYFSPPDGGNIIDIESKEGYLFKVEKALLRN